MYNKETLANGARILTEPMEGIRSAAVGIWVTSGSRDELARENGSAHFIEHMVFKGSETVSAGDLARRMDAVGGQFNAFTTKECTCFYARVLDYQLPEALDILFTFAFEAKFAQEDVDTERGVVLEEIGMYRDEPDDLVSEQLIGKMYRGSSLARPILGTPASLSRLNSPELKHWHSRHYGPEHIIVSLAGSFDPAITGLIRSRLQSLTPGSAGARKPAVYQPAFVLRKKRCEQNNLIVAFPSVPTGHPDRFAVSLLSTILGGGQSSRLFQEVREKQGLCYTVYSYTGTYQDTGYFGIYTGTGRETEQKALSTINRVVLELADHGVTEDELFRAREQAKSGVLMALESTTSRMSTLAHWEIDNNGVFMTPDEVIGAYDAVTAEEVRTIAQRTFDYTQASFSAVGKLGSEDLYRQIREGKVF